MRRSLVVGNWKMHGNSASITSLVEGIKTGLQAQFAEGLEQSSPIVAVCPPAIYIPLVADSLRGCTVGWGGQNLSDQPEGAFTGEISAQMLADLGCQFAIVGHSERRTLFAETDQVVAGKFIAAQRCGMSPILCVGESLEQRQAGGALAWIEQQLKLVVEAVGIGAFADAVVAYEPIWAIGTGETATPQQAQQVHAHIRKILAGWDGKVADNLSILYGGSVKPANAAELFAEDDIDGALVGGASLQAEDFVAIVKAA